MNPQGNLANGRRKDEDSPNSLQHTLGHLNCPACSQVRSVFLRRITKDLTFSEAATLWLEARTVSATPGAISARYIKPNTEMSYRQYITSLNLFFSALALENIHIGHIRAYQAARVAGNEPFIRKRRKQEKVASSCPAAPKKVNQELTILKLILRRGGCWTPELEEFYEPLLERDPGLPRALTVDEQQLWLDVSRMKEKWHIIYWYSVLAFGTSMSTNEIRSLRIGDVDLFHRVLSVPAEGAKNKYRQRTIPLQSAEVLWASEQLLNRARDLGCVLPNHYLFPFRKNPEPFDPTRPMTVSGIKKPWEEVRTASGLTWFRPYDTRHTAITRWAEQGMNIEVAMRMAGHIGRRMHEHYMHISDMAQRHELDRIKVDNYRIPPQSVRIRQPIYLPNRRA